MGADSTESARDRARGRSVRTFRTSALGLLLGATPLIFAWGTGDFGDPPPGVPGVALDGRWIANWLIPACVAAVLAYGTTRTGPDHRLVAAGRTDLRTAWWSTHLTPLTAVACGSASLSFSLSHWTGEPMATLVVPCLVGVVLACCIAAVVVTRWWSGPSVAMGVSTLATVVTLILPYRVSELRALAVDGTLARWMIDGLPGRVGIPPAALVWLTIAAGIVLINRYLPRDVSGLGWLGKEVTDRD